MELRSNASILRSNAPALGGPESQKGVLQISSGNVGSNTFDSTLGASKGTVFDEYEVSAPPLSAIPRCPSPQATLKLQRRKQRRAKDGKSDTYQMYSQVVTQAERLSPRYQAYREKLRKDMLKGTKNEPVWPDDLEEIFQQALRVIPHWGRKKRWLGGKLSGRNEWISRYIRIHSGEDRDRKQVSSHIQVLKPFLQDNPIWMKFVTDLNNTAEPGFRSSTDFQSPILTEAQLLSSKPLPAPGILGSNVPPQPPCLRQVEFEMYVLDPQNSSIHTYTVIQSEIGTAPKLLENQNAWQLEYPDLELYDNESQRNGEVILFEAEFRLMDNHPTPGSKLGVNFFVDITRGLEFKDWKYKTKFFEKGVPVKFQGNGYLSEDPNKVNMIEGVSGALKHSQDPLTKDTRLEIAFRSSWWVAVFFNMTNKRLKVAEETNGDPDALKQEEERANRYLQEMSVMQEVYATPRVGASTPQRICVFLWKFCLARNGVAFTTWRKLKLPVSEVEAESPAPAPNPLIYQSSDSHSTTLQYNTCLQPSPLHAKYFNHNANDLLVENSDSLLAAVPSESDSSSTPTADQPSFRTSTSFESSVSSSTLPPYTSQPPAYHSQEYGYSSQETTTASQGSVDNPEDYAFSSQESNYMSHDAVFDIQLPDCQSHDPTKPSQDLYYASQADSAYYSQEQANIYEEALYAAQTAHHDQAPIDADTQDFTGGQIHLSYIEPAGEQPPDYDSPYAADAADQNRLAPHQELDHPSPEYYQLPQHQEYTHHEQHQHQDHQPPNQQQEQEQVQVHEHFDPTDWNPSLFSTMHFHPIDFADMADPVGARLDEVPRTMQRVLAEVPSHQGHVLGEVGEGEGEGEGLRECPNLVEQAGGGLGEGGTGGMEFF